MRPGREFLAVEVGPLEVPADRTGPAAPAHSGGERPRSRTVQFQDVMDQANELPFLADQFEATQREAAKAARLRLPPIGGGGPAPDRFVHHVLGHYSARTPR